MCVWTGGGCKGADFMWKRKRKKIKENKAQERKCGVHGPALCKCGFKWNQMVGVAGSACQAPPDSRTPLKHTDACFFLADGTVPQTKAVALYRVSRDFYLVLWSFPQFSWRTRYFPPLLSESGSADATWFSSAQESNSSSSDPEGWSLYEDSGVFLCFTLKMHFEKEA